MANFELKVHDYVTRGKKDYYLKKKNKYNQKHIYMSLNALLNDIKKSEKVSNFKTKHI